jgi:DNA-binding MarR family transcriptional regulator
MTAVPPLPQSIGQAENALRAILNRELAGPGLSYVQWVTLSLIARSGSAVPQEQLIEQLVPALKHDSASMLTALDELTTRELVTPPDGAAARVTLTTSGDALVRCLRQDIAQITERLYGDLPANDLTTTQRVLGIVAERADMELRR